MRYGNIKYPIMMHFCGNLAAWLISMPPFGKTVFVINIAVLVIGAITLICGVVAVGKNMDKIKKAEPKRAIPMIYKRIVNKYGDTFISNGEIYTPNEYGIIFSKLIGYDIMPFIELVEKAAYRDEEIDNSEVSIALEMYLDVKKALKVHNKKMKRKC
jgi:hypothetical protein